MLHVLYAHHDKYSANRQNRDKKMIVASINNIKKTESGDDTNARNASAGNDFKKQDLSIIEI